MPKETLEYYRYRKVYSPMEFNSPHFQEILREDHYDMQKRLPKDCDYLSFSFSYTNEDGNRVYEYFESEDECRAAEAVQFNDESIYKNYRLHKREETILKKHKYGA